MAMPERFNLPGVHALRVYTFDSTMKPCLTLQKKNRNGRNEEQQLQQQQQQKRADQRLLFDH